MNARVARKGRQFQPTMNTNLDEANSWAAAALGVLLSSHCIHEYVARATRSSGGEKKPGASGAHPCVGCGYSTGKGTHAAHVVTSAMRSSRCRRARTARRIPAAPLPLSVYMLGYASRNCATNANHGSRDASLVDVDTSVSEDAAPCIAVSSSDPTDDMRDRPAATGCSFCAVAPPAGPAAPDCR